MHGRELPSNIGFCADFLECIGPKPAYEDTVRFGELRKLIPDVTQRMLTHKLRELESQGVIERTVYPIVPPKVEYKLTERGKSLKPVLDALSEWSLKHGSLVR